MAVFAQEGVDDGRLAHIRFAHHGDFGQLIDDMVLFVGEVLHHGIQQFAGAAARHGGDGEDFIHAEGIEFGIVEIVGGTVDFVDGQIERLLGAAQQGGNLLVERGEAFAAVHYQHNHVRLVDGQGGLLADFSLEDVGGAHHVAAGVDDGKFVAAPVRFAVVAVAGHTGNAVHDVTEMSKLDKVASSCSLSEKEMKRAKELGLDYIK